jgi:hypothetical protein
MAELNIKSDELCSFLGEDVSVTLHGDQRDCPSIFGHVQLVKKTHIQLAAPATIDGNKRSVYQINIEEIAKCTSILDNLEQHEKGPQTYIQPHKTPFKCSHTHAPFQSQA